MNNLSLIICLSRTLLLWPTSQDWEMTYGPVYQTNHFWFKDSHFVRPQGDCTLLFKGHDDIPPTTSHANNDEPSVSFLLLYCVREVTRIPDSKFAHDHGRRNPQEVTPLFYSK